MLMQTKWHQEVCKICNAVSYFQHISLSTFYNGNLHSVGFLLQYSSYPLHLTHDQSLLSSANTSTGGSRWDYVPYRSADTVDSDSGALSMAGMIPSYTLGFQNLFTQHKIIIGYNGSHVALRKNINTHSLQDDMHKLAWHSSSKVSLTGV